MNQSLDFEQINTVSFKTILTWLNIPYEETKNGELKGYAGDFHFIANVLGNHYFCPQDDANKGSIINFISRVKKISLREAAAQIKWNFIDTHKPDEEEVADLNLEYHPALEQRGISEEEAKTYELGYCTQGIMRGRIAVPIHDKDGNKVAYCGYSIRGDHQPGLLFPQGYENKHIWNFHRIKDKKGVQVYMSPFDAIKNETGVALLTPNATDEQIELLKEFTTVLLYLPKGEDIAMKLVRHCFVRVFD